MSQHVSAGIPALLEMDVVVDGRSLWHRKQVVMPFVPPLGFQVDGYVVSECEWSTLDDWLVVLLADSAESLTVVPKDDDWCQLLNELSDAGYRRMYE